MSSLITFSIAKDWISNLSKELLRINEQRNNELSLVNDIFGDPIELSKYYVEPDCQQFNPADDNEDGELFIIREPIFARIENFINERRPNRANQMMVLSDAGMGKTSLLVMVKLSNLLKFWPGKFKCALLKSSASTIDNIGKLTDKRNTILLIDAIDEDELAWGETRKRIVELLSATTPFRCVILTCRTQFFSGGFDPFNRRGQVELGGFLVPVVYLSLFSKKQISEYLTKRFAKRKNRKELMTQSMSIVGKIGSLRMRPMILSHIEDLLDSNNSDWTEYNLYKTLIYSWLLREQTKLFKQKHYPEVNSLLTACREIALFMNKNNHKRISKKEIELLIKSHPDIMYIDFMSLGGRSLLNKDSDGNYRFSHFSILEFLVLDSIVEQKKDPLSEKLIVTDQISKFFSSWMSKASLLDIVDIRINFFNLSLIKSHDLRKIKLEIDGIDFRKFYEEGLSVENVKTVNKLMNSYQVGNWIILASLLSSGS